MRFITRLFRQDTPQSSLTNPAGIVILTDAENPPFKYLQQQHSCNIDAYSRVADLLRSVAIASATRFARLTSSEANAHVAHYFFDLYLVLHSKLLAPDDDNDLSSACVDGIHFKYHGQPTPRPVESVLELLAGRNDRCFLASFFSVLKGTDFPMKLGTYAHYCCSRDVPGATESLAMGQTILSMAKEMSEPLGKEMQDILHR